MPRTTTSTEPAKVWLQLNRENIRVAGCMAGRSGAAAVRAGGAEPVVGRRHHIIDVVGWVYIAFVIDAYTRRIGQGIVEWSTGPRR